MPTGSKLKTRAAATKPSRTKGSALDSRKRELSEQESKLQAQIDALQKTIAEAPGRAAEQAKRDRDTLITASRGYYLHSVVPDSRFGQGTGAAVRRSGSRPMLKAERTAARTQTLALVVVLAVAVIWLLSHLIQ
jgi:hypothetical protein